VGEAAEVEAQFRGRRYGGRGRGHLIPPPLFLYQYNKYIPKIIGYIFTLSGESEAHMSERRLRREKRMT